MSICLFFFIKTRSLKNLNLNNYCDNHQFDDNCEFCPPGAVCSSGQIQNCETGFQFLNDEACISMSKYSQLTLEMADYCLQLSASVNGFNMCGGMDLYLSQNKAYFKDLTIHLEQEFGQSQSFNKSLEELKILLQDQFFFRLEFLKNDYYLVSGRVNLSSWCKLKIIFRDYLQEFGILFLILCCLLVFYIVEIRINRNIRTSEKIYNKILNKLKMEQKVNFIRCRLMSLCRWN
jgi:hypothetical protein